jgi:hypothetical protein
MIALDATELNSHDIRPFKGGILLERSTHLVSAFEQTRTARTRCCVEADAPQRFRKKMAIETQGHR